MYEQVNKLLKIKPNMNIGRQKCKVKTMNNLKNCQIITGLIHHKDMLSNPILSALGLKWQNLAPYIISNSKNE